MLKLSKSKIMVILAERGLTVKMLAEQMGIRANNLSALLNKNHVQTTTAGKLAAALDVPVESIIER